MGEAAFLRGRKVDAPLLLEHGCALQVGTVPALQIALRYGQRVDTSRPVSPDRLPGMGDYQEEGCFAE